MKFKFTCIDTDEKGTGRRVTISLDTVRMDDVLEDFENFLTACGFVHGGSLTFDSQEKSEAVERLKEELRQTRGQLEFFREKVIAQGSRHA